MCFTGKWRCECSFCNYIPVVFLFDDGRRPLRNALMSLADSKTRFSISVGAVEASALVSDIDLILRGLDDRRPS